VLQIDRLGAGRGAARAGRVRAVCRRGSLIPRGCKCDAATPISLTAAPPFVLVAVQRDGAQADLIMAGGAARRHRLFSQLSAHACLLHGLAGVQNPRCKQVHPDPPRTSWARAHSSFPACAGARTFAQRACAMSTGLRAVWFFAKNGVWGLRHPLLRRARCRLLRRACFVAACAPAAGLRKLEFRVGFAPALCQY